MRASDTFMDRQWFVAAPAGVLGPMDGAAVVALVRSGAARPDTQVCTADDHQWVEMRYFPELAGEMAHQDAMAWAEPHVPAPPPPPGEPWFYNVPIGRTVLFQCLSLGFYYALWESEHRSWLQRRRPRPQLSDLSSFETLLPAELASAHAHLGLPGPSLCLPPVSPAMHNLAYFTFILLPIVAILELQNMRTAQAAAEIVNRAVAPDATPPPIGAREWTGVAIGVLAWSVATFFVWLAAL